MLGIPDKASSDEWEDEKSGVEKKGGGDQDTGLGRARASGSAGTKRKH